MRSTLLILATLVLAITPAAAQSDTAEQVRKELAMLPFYTVFDHLECRIEGDHVELTGQVSRAALRDEAERAVADLDCVEGVVNRIEVMPASARDDRIRLAAYRTLSGHADLRFYVATSLPSIHIVVRDRVVTLTGTVSTEAERLVAEQLLRSVEDVQNVRNKLKTPRS